MSANNYLTVERKDDKWAVHHKNADTGESYDYELYDTRDEAIDNASDEACNGFIEYGISYIEPSRLKDNSVKKGNK